jgi:hypothetical protein
VSDQKHIVDEPPPVLRTWPCVYAFVLSYLMIVIILFYLFTVHFTP